MHILLFFFLLTLFTFISDYLGNHNASHISLCILFTLLIISFHYSLHLIKYSLNINHNFLYNSLYSSHPLTIFFTLSHYSLNPITVLITFLCMYYLSTDCIDSSHHIWLQYTSYHNVLHITALFTYHTTPHVWSQYSLHYHSTLPCSTQFYRFAPHTTFLLKSHTVGIKSDTKQD